MFAPIVQNRPLLRDRKANRIRGGDFAPVMNRPSAREENYLPSRLPAAPAPIHIIAIHEQVFIEQAHFVESFAADHREAAHQDIDGSVRSWGK